MSLEASSIVRESNEHTPTLPHNHHHNHVLLNDAPASSPTSSSSPHTLPPSPSPSHSSTDPSSSPSPSSNHINNEPTNIGTQITQAFARLSVLASESVSTTFSLKTTNAAGNGGGGGAVGGGGGGGTSNMNNASFWKRKGKVPGTVKAVKGTFPPRSDKPNGFMARPPTPPKDGYPEYESAHDSPIIPSSSSPAHSPAVYHPSPIIDHHASVHSNTNSPEPSQRNNEPEYEHYCRSFGSCGTPTERASRLAKFRRMLKEPIVDLEALKKLSWKGIPNEVRPMTWKLLLGYLPANVERREVILERKRKEYMDCIPQHFNVEDEERTEYERKIFRQIEIDVPRTNPNVPLFQQPIVQRILERILYIWAIRHPASGYVQGINDLATPFLVVFLSELVDDVDNCEINKVNPSLLDLMEADTFWCMSKLLDGIQDHYTFAQPGIQRMTFKLKELVGRIDAPLARHLEDQGAQFIVFAFRWMNCLLMREMPLPLVVRMWDTYLSEGPSEGFSVFHVYVCAAFLVMWSDELRQRDFQDIILFLQHLPTTQWQCKDIEMLVSQAYLWMTIFQNAPSHLKSAERVQGFV